ncbi:unnamed protein product, partial [Rotaria sp. Silwood1]
MIRTCFCVTPTGIKSAYRMAH